MLMFSQDRYSFQTAALRPQAAAVPRGSSFPFALAGTDLSALFHIFWEVLQGALRSQGLRNQQGRRVQSKKHLYTYGGFSM